MCIYNIPPTTPPSQSNIIPKCLETACSGGEKSMILMSIMSWKCKLLKGNSNWFGTSDVTWCDFREMRGAGELTAVHVLAGSGRPAAARLSAAPTLPWLSTSFFCCCLPWVLWGKLHKRVPMPTAAQPCGHLPSPSRMSECCLCNWTDLSSITKVRTSDTIKVLLAWQ